MADQPPPLRVLFTCSGVDSYPRGFESFFREAFDGLKHAPGLHCLLLKGGGERKPDEFILPKLYRDGFAAKAIGRVFGRSGYSVEQGTTFLPVARHIRRFRPQVIFFSDSNLGFLLFHLRRFIGVPYRLLYSNSGPGGPRFPRADFIHQVAPLYMEQSIAAGEPPGRHMLVPFGISTPPPPQFDAEKRRTIRSRLGMPLDRPVVLSVGWISRQHKRMDYTISEIARMPTPRPFLQLLGAMDTNSAEVVEMGRRLLGPDGFAASSVPYRDVADYYRAADAFVLASLKEGFGRVYLEALMHGLPVIAHDYPVMRYVLNSEATFIDMATPGALSAATAATLAVPLDDRAMKKRWQSVYDRFDWRVLAPDYARMFAAAAVWPLPARDAHLDANRHPV